MTNRRVNGYKSPKLYGGPDKSELTPRQLAVYQALDRRGDVLIEYLYEVYKDRTDPHYKTHEKQARLSGVVNSINKKIACKGRKIVIGATRRTYCIERI